MKPVRFSSVFLLLVCVAFAPAALAQKARLINDAASRALDQENFVNQNGIVTLYGTRTNGPDTNHGQLACAKVVTIVLKKAGALSEISLGVRHVESALKNWKKIETEEGLRPGDVIVWINRFSGRADGWCTGGGNCHAGIVTEKGYFHNDPRTLVPTYGGASLLAFRFKAGYRPPG